MSDEKNTLQSVTARIKAGLGRINAEAKAKASGKQTSNPKDELGVDNELDQPSHLGVGDRLSAHDYDHGDIDDAFIIDAEPEPTKPKRKSLGNKQKLLLVLGALAVGIWYTKHQENVPAPASIPAEEQHLDGFKSGGSANTEVPGPTFNLEDSAPHSNEPIPKAPGVASDDDLGFGKASAKDAANDPISSDAVTADLNEQFESTSEGNEVLDPFTGKVTTVAEHPAELPAPEKHDAGPAPISPAIQPATKPAADNLAASGAPSHSPFDVGSSNSTGLSGTKNQNPDSKKGVLQDQSANADVAALKAKTAEKDSRIGSLETEVSKLKKDLATAKHDLEAANHGQAKSSPSKATQHKPVQAAHTAQRSTPSQRVASAPKAVPRPQVCVTAVAQAARNCTTCVPHAFITHRGAETMVGQGDFLEGLRVNIVGDRLDLQNANGEVVHKFWSSPNGCAAG